MFMYINMDMKLVKRNRKNVFSSYVHLGGLGGTRTIEESLRGLIFKVRLWVWVMFKGDLTIFGIYRWNCMFSFFVLKNPIFPF